MEISSLEAEAKAKAAKHVANMLHAPDKLEKITQMKFNVERKKASVEAMMKTAMQSQLDGVKTGLTLLERAKRDIGDVHLCMAEMDESLREIPSLLDELHDVREETIKHSQLATARDNLKHIFMVPETVRQTETQIQDGKLLDAHKSLVELENSRDDLLFELHKLPHQSTADKELLKEYFEPVTHLSDKMEKQIRGAIHQCLRIILNLDS
jgi:exocyst complex component 3